MIYILIYHNMIIPYLLFVSEIGLYFLPSRRSHDFLLQHSGSFSCGQPHVIWFVGDLMYIYIYIILSITTRIMITTQTYVDIVHLYQVMNHLSIHGNTTPIDLLSVPKAAAGWWYIGCEAVHITMSLKLVVTPISGPKNRRIIDMKLTKHTRIIPEQ